MSHRYPVAGDPWIIVSGDNRNHAAKLAQKNVVRADTVFELEGAIHEDITRILQLFPSSAAEWQMISDALRKSSLPDFSADTLLQRICRFFKLWRLRTISVQGPVQLRAPLPGKKHLPPLSDSTEQSWVRNSKHTKKELFIRT